MTVYIRPTLTDLAPSIHGARDYKELTRLGLHPDDIIDFSANSNPYGPHPDVLEAVKAAVNFPTLARYPDRDCLALRESIAAAEDVSVDHILPTNGASELIQLISMVFVEPGSRHLVLAPTFGEYSRAIHLMGGAICEHHPGHVELRFDRKTTSDAIRKHQPGGIWFCNPNNPTGQQWATDELAQLYAADPDRMTLWVIDESYRYFGKWDQQTATAKRLAISEQNVIIIRSLTKAHSLAGLRLGYAVAAPKLIEALRAAQPPWSVNSLAQVAGVAALQPKVLSWRKESLAQLHQHAAALWAKLSTLGFIVLPTSTTYALVKVDDAPVFRRSLLAHGLLVRDCTSFGLPQYVRIAARLPEENERLLTVLKQKVEGT